MTPRILGVLSVVLGAAAYDGDGVTLVQSTIRASSAELRSAAKHMKRHHTRKKAADDDRPAEKASSPPWLERIEKWAANQVDHHRKQLPRADSAAKDASPKASAAASQLASKDEVPVITEQDFADLAQVSDGTSIATPARRVDLDAVEKKSAPSAAAEPAASLPADFAPEPVNEPSEKGPPELEEKTAEAAPEVAPELAKEVAVEPEPSSESAKEPAAKPVEKLPEVPEEEPEPQEPEHALDKLLGKQAGASLEEIKKNISAIKGELERAEGAQVEDSEELEAGLNKVQKELARLPVEELVESISRVERHEKDEVDELRTDVTQLAEKLAAVPVEEIKQNLSKAGSQQSVDELRSELVHLGELQANATGPRAQLRHLEVVQALLEQPLKELARNITRLQKAQSEGTKSLKELHETVRRSSDAQELVAVPVAQLKRNISRLEAIQSSIPVDDMWQNLTRLQEQQAKAAGPIEAIRSSLARLESLQSAIPVDEMWENITRLSAQQAQARVPVEELRQSLARLQYEVEELRSSAPAQRSSSDEDLREALQTELLEELHIAEHNISEMEEQVITANSRAKSAEMQAEEAERKALASEERAERAERAAEEAERASEVIAERMKARLMDVERDHARLAQARLPDTLDSVSGKIQVQDEASPKAIGNATDVAASAASEGAAANTSQVKKVPTTSCERWPTEGRYGCSQGHSTWWKLSKAQSEDDCRSRCKDSVSQWGNLCCVLAKSGCWAKPNSSAFRYAKGVGRGISCMEAPTQVMPHVATMP